MFAIIGAPRTGTEAVCSALGAHPSVTCVPEPFHRDVEYRKKVHAMFIGDDDPPLHNRTSLHVAYLQRYSEKFPNFGVKMLYGQCSEGVLKALSEHKVIHTVRSIEDSYRSLARAEASGVFHLVEEGSELLGLGPAYATMRMGVPAEECRSMTKSDHMLHVEQWRNYVRETIPAANLLEVHDLALDMRSIQEFLGIPYSPKAVPQTRRHVGT